MSKALFIWKPMGFIEGEIMGKASRMKKQKAQLANIAETISAKLINAFDKGDPSKLVECVELAEQAQLSIWDINIKLENAGTGTVGLFNPLFVAMAVEQEGCFKWLLKHARKSYEGAAVAGELYTNVLSTMDSMELGSIRYELGKLLVRDMLESAYVAGANELVQYLANSAKASSEATAVVKDFLAEKNAIRQHAELVAYLEELGKAENAAAIEEAIAIQHGVVEPNHEAIIVAGAAVEAAKESSRPRSKSKSI